MNSSERTYWQNFYASFQEYTSSSFARFVHGFLHEKGLNKKHYRLLDVGCGNGRDSYYFAQQKDGCEYDVCGMDASHTPRVREGCRFFLSDMTTYDGYDAYDVLYARFTFHSITDEQQESLLGHIQRPGIILCIETRSTKGYGTDCVHGNDSHFRNLTNADRLKGMLERHDFDIMHFEEGTGMAKHKNEDPVCIRVICKKRTRV